MSKMSDKKIIGITGSMGSGKSKVSEILKQWFPVTDCDGINECLLRKGNEGYCELIQKPYISLLENGGINKLAMAQVMFADAKIKKEVESILHPLIFLKMNEWVQQQKSNVVFVEVPLLFEIEAQHRFDEIWCVVCSESIALERLQAYRHISNEQAKARLATQMSVDEKIKRSDVIIYNDDSVEMLEKQIQERIEKEGFSAERNM